MKHLPKLLLVLLLGAGLLTLLPKTVHAAQLNCVSGSDDLKPFGDTPSGIAACLSVNALFNNSATPGPWYDQNPNQFAAKVFGGDQSEIFGERYTYAQINWIINSIAAMINPALKINNPSQLFDFIKAINKVSELSSTGQSPSFAEFSQLGPVGLFAGAVNMVYANPVASGVGETQSTISRVFDGVTGTKIANAQGYGFAGLSSGGAVKKLWTATRNMAYLIVVVLLIAAGFLIMFRVKINPQTVVSLQTMIPKLIITMILITFSFAIAGFVVDLIYVAIVAFMGFISLPGSNIIGSGVPGFNLTTFVTQAGFLSYFVAQIITPFLISLIISIALFAGTILSGGFLLPVGIVSLILCAIVIVFFYIVLIRIFLMLLTAYVTLMLLTCVAPLQIMMDLIPGQKGFGPWLRNMIANASVFVVVPIMFVIQHVISGDIASVFFGISSSGVTADLRLPFLFGSTTQAQFGGWLLDWVVGLTILAMTPKVASIIRDALKIPPFKYANALGEATGETQKWYQGVIASQRQKEQDALTRAKIAEDKTGLAGTSQPLSGGMGGEYYRARQQAGAQATKATAATDTPKPNIT